MCMPNLLVHPCDDTSSLWVPLGNSQGSVRQRRCKLIVYVVHFVGILLYRAGLVGSVTDGSYFWGFQISSPVVAGYDELVVFCCLFEEWGYLYWDSL